MFVCKYGKMIGKKQKQCGNGSMGLFVNGSMWQFGVDEFKDATLFHGTRI